MDLTEMPTHLHKCQLGGCDADFFIELHERTCGQIGRHHVVLVLGAPYPLALVCNREAEHAEPTREHVEAYRIQLGGGCRTIERSS